MKRFCNGKLDLKAEMQPRMFARTLLRSVFPTWHTEDIDLESSVMELHEGDEKTEDRSPTRDFLAAISGRDIPDNGLLTLQQKAYVGYVKQRIKSYPMCLFADILHGKDRKSAVEIDTDEVFVLLTCVAETARKGGQFSIEAVLKQAVEEGIIVKETLQAPLRLEALTVLFSCVAWVSMLYPPAAASTIPSETIAIDRSQCVCIADSQPVSNTSRPLCEVIQEFGPLLPISQDSSVPNISDSVFSATSLYVSLLNASTLTRIGRIEIAWVSNIGSHLAFNPETRKLFLFSAPSFCTLSEDQRSSFAKIVSCYYDEYNMPQGFSGSAFLKEVRRSYSLIFSDDSRATKHYNKKERKKLRKYGSIDPYLDELCRRGERGKCSYGKTTDFPIFAARLSVIQEYIQRQNPDTIAMLWQDRRNLLQWYTFWAVTIIGSLGIILSMVQTGLAAAQVYFLLNPPRP